MTFSLQSRHALGETGEYARPMSRVATIGARLSLDERRTDAAFLAVRIGMFAKLGDGRRVPVDPASHAVGGPRRGAGALWGALTVNVHDLPSLNHELFATDPAHGRNGGARR
jgi:hypothetical protein